MLDPTSPRPRSLSGLDIALIAVLVLIVGGVGTVWLTGELAALLASGHTVVVGPGDLAHVVVRLPSHLADPARAWPRRTTTAPRSSAQAPPTPTRWSTWLGCSATRRSPRSQPPPARPATARRPKARPSAPWHPRTWCARANPAPPCSSTATCHQRGCDCDRGSQTGHSADR